MSARTICVETTMSVEATQLVDDVMRRWPMTIRVFLSHRMHCVGCPITCFHTVADACREHGVDQAEFLAELSAIIRGQAVATPESSSMAIAARWPT